MAALDFPTSPTEGQLFPATTPRWKYSSGKWVAYGSTTPFYTAAFFSGIPEANDVLISMDLPCAATFAEDLAGWRCSADDAATAETVLLVKYAGTSVGTITFAAEGAVATLSAEEAIAGEQYGLLEVLFPATADATLGNVRLTISGVRA